MNNRIAPLILLSVLLAACSGQPTKTVETNDDAPVFVSKGQLSNIDTMISNGRLLDAEHALEIIDPLGLPELDHIHYYWLSANLAIELSRGDDALSALNALPPGEFVKLPWVAPYAPGFLRSQALFLKGEFIASARERMFMSEALKGDAYRFNHEGIWKSLNQASLSELEGLNAKTTTYAYKGWLELAIIMKRHQMDIDRQLSSLRLWQSQYAQHPAAEQLPGGLDQLETYVLNKPKHIALMLPLSGKLGSTGKAIRDGLFAAYYQAQKAGAEVPSIRVYDTAKSTNFWDLYKKGVMDGAQLVIGPIQKLSVERLQQESQLPVPTLALNYGVRDFGENPDNLYQFGLAVEDEAELAARYARQQGYERAVALMPKGPWGERVFKRFSEVWQGQGGQVVEAKFFSGKGDYNRVIRDLFAVEDSERRAKSLRKQLGQKIEFQARRREDVDFIFLAALPQQARQIKPTLAFNYAGSLPVIATSHIYSGQLQTSKDRDLENIVFCDIPWVFENSQLRKDIHKLWPKSKSAFDRLFALGVDSYQLYTRLGQLKVLNHSQVQGQTGLLSMDQHGQIIRYLPFATFTKGRPKLTQGVIKSVEASPET